MAEEKLSGKVGLDTTNFKTNVAGMNRELRVLESGFRASAASLGDWANDATGLELRIKSLNGQMDIQKQKVAATRAEYERIKGEKGENSRAAQDLEIKLNKETETLGKMENELHTTEGSLEEMRSGSDKAADAVDHLDDEQKQATDSGKKFRGVVDDLGRTMKSLAIIAVGVVKAVAAIAVGVAAAAIALVAFTTGPASDLNETISKTEVVFGAAADQVLAFGEDSATAFGLSKNAALGAAGTYGNLLRAMGLAEDQSADMSIELVKLAADLASFNNLKPEEVLDKLRAGLTGEAEPLKQLGVNMNQARIEAKALELGLIKQGDELTAAAKAQAAYAIILEDTALAQGDFARTSEGQANQQRIFAAQLENLRAKMGNAFLPIVNLATTALNELLSSTEFTEGIEGLVDWLGELAQSLEPVVEIVSTAIRQLLGGDFAGALTTFLGADNASVVLNFIGMIRDFIQNTLLPFVTTHAEEIKAALIGIGVALGAAGIVAAIAGIVAAINPVTLIIAGIAAAVGLLAAAWTGNWGGMRDTITEFWEGRLQPLLQQLWSWLSTNIPAAIQTLSDFWTGTLLPAIQAVWGFLSGSVFPLFQAIGAFIGAVFNLYVRVMAGLWQNILLPALQSIWNFLNTNIFPVFKAIGDYLSKTFQPVLDRLASFLKGSLSPAFNGISSAIQSAISWISNLADAINNLELPAWLEPGSPTPWELGLIGINRALQDLNNELPIMARGLNGVAFAGAVPGVPTTSTQNDQFQFFAPVIVQDTQPGGLGGMLKGKRF